MWERDEVGDEGRDCWSCKGSGWRGTNAGMGAMTRNPGLVKEGIDIDWLYFDK